ncbi:MAG: hypothetical protein GEU80_04660 [Dehalococcoidia bacterium]|nr:hypothetical protein [Dehalococcoidia bacterium]
MRMRSLNLVRPLLVLAAFVAMLPAIRALPVAAQASPSLDIAVEAEVIEAGAPMSVEATTPVRDADGLWSHGVVVTWNDSQPAMLDDTRFTHHVSAEAGDGDLVTSGRGCGAEWNDEQDEVLHFCTLDLQLIEVGPGEAHEYPVRVYPEVGPLALEPGTYVLEQAVQWWRQGAEQDPDEFTIRLTYEVTEGAAADLDIAVHAAVMGDGAPFTVEATTMTSDANGRPAHGVVVTWNGTETVMLEDARFVHHIHGAGGAGDLVTAGRGCGAQWDAQAAELVQACQDDLLLIELEPGETHEYPVVIYPEVGPLALEPGTYTVDEVIGWWPVDDETDRDQVTVRLTYTVGATTPGTLTPEPAATGASLATWGGGSVGQLPKATAYWVTAEGEFVGYVPGAPAFVNASFLTLYPGGQIPAGTVLVVVR